MQLQPASRRSRIWIQSLTVVLPMAIGSTAIGFVLSGLEPGSLDLRLAAVLIAAVLLVGGMSVLFDRVMRRHYIELSADALTVVTSFYSRRVPLAQLDLGHARVVDLRERTEFKPMLKTNGMAVPGFHSGWFRLRNWNSALIATSDNPRVLWLPTRLSYGLLLQPQQPEALLDRLRSMTAANGSHH